MLPKSARLTCKVTSIGSRAEDPRTRQPLRLQERLNLNAPDMADAPRLSEAVSWTVRDVVVGAGVIVIGTFALAALLIASPLGPKSEADSIGIGFFWIVAVLQGVLTLFVVWRFVVRKYNLSWSALGLKRPVGKYVNLLALAALLGSLGFTAMYGAVVSALGLDLLLPEPVPEELANRRFFVITAIVIAGWVPFAEEVFFRGFVFSGLAAKYGILAAGAISAALFSVAHLSLGSLLPVFVTGLLFAWLYHRTKSVWAPVSAHAGQNLIALSFAGTL